MEIKKGPRGMQEAARMGNKPRFSIFYCGCKQPKSIHIRLRLQRYEEKTNRATHAAKFFQRWHHTFAIGGGGIAHHCVQCRQFARHLFGSTAFSPYLCTHNGPCRNSPLCKPPAEAASGNSVTTASCRIASQRTARHGTANREPERAEQHK